jgi:vesicle coat complex subunit
MSVNEIFPWLFTLIKQASLDTNPYVRKTGLTSLLKLRDLTEFSYEEYKDEVDEIILRGLKDRDEPVLA